jgi:hypothetical protein
MLDIRTPSDTHTVEELKVLGLAVGTNLKQFQTGTGYNISLGYVKTIYRFITHFFIGPEPVCSTILNHLLCWNIRTNPTGGCLDDTLSC